MKKILCLVISLIMLVGAVMLPSCAKDEKDKGSEVSVQGSSETDYLSTLQAPDFDDGEEFVIYQFGTATVAQGVDFTEVTGEKICDSLFWRNAEIESQYGVKIVYEGACKSATSIGDTTTQFITIQNMTQGEKIDLWELSPVYATQLMYGGDSFLSVKDMPYVDMSKDWWATESNDLFEINGKIYVAAGDVSLSFYGMPYSMAFNKDIAAQYNLDKMFDKDLYSLARDKQWTYEKMLAMSIAATDPGGDQILKPTDDQYGFQYDMGCAMAFMVSLGENFSRVENGLPVVDMLSESMINAAEWIRENLGIDSTHAIGGYTKDTDVLAIFPSGRALFTSAQFSHLVSKFRNYSFNYGIVPMPMKDEDQGQYYSYANVYYAAYVSVPSYTQNRDKVGFMLEAMAYKSYDKVRPTYIDECLVGRADSYKDAEMLGIALDTVYYDLNLVMNFGKTRDNYAKYIHGQIDEYTSTMKGAEDTYKKEIQQYIDSFKDTAN